MRKLFRQIAAAAVTALLIPTSVSSKNKDAQSDSQPEPSSLNSAPCLTWSAFGRPRAALLCIHGLGLYSGSYKNFGHRMGRMGISTYAIDVRGFGSWMKANGHATVDFDGCLSDIKSALEAIRNANPDVPVFLLGESMGGAIALRAASMYPDLVHGLISSVPAGDRFKQKRTDLLVAAEMLKGPHHEFPIGDKIVKQATANPKLQQDWIDNPLDRMDLSPKELMQFQKFMNENHDVAPKIGDIPVLVVQGNKDKLVKPEGTWQIFNEIGSQEKTFLAVPSEHLIFEDQQDDASIFDMRIDQLISAWVLVHARTPGAATGSTTATDAAEAAVAKAIEANLAGHYDQAIALLKPVLVSDPGNAEAHYWTAVALLKGGKSADARGEFVKAMRARRSTAARTLSANNYLLSMDAPDAVPTTQQSSESKSKAAELSGGKFTVAAFYAPWAEQCNCVDPMFARAKQTYGDKLQLLKINVDDSSNIDTVKSLEIGPIPTFVFVKPDGTIVGSLIGTPTFVNFAKDIGKLGLSPGASK